MRWPYLRRSLHICDKALDLRIVFNDRDVLIPSLPTLPTMICCPFCGHRLHDMTRERDEKYRRRAYVAQPSECTDTVVEMVRRLIRPDYPLNGIVSHFGVFASVRGLSVNVSSHGGLLHVTMYQSLYHRPKAIHRDRANAVATGLLCAIRTTWNGGEGHDGVSVILDRPPPESLIVAQGNYHAQRDVFRPTPAEKAGYLAFREWYDTPLVDDGR